MIGFLMAVFWSFIAFLTGWAMYRQVRAHRELRQAIKDLESSYQELRESMGSAIGALEEFVKPTEVLNEELRGSYVTAYRISHFDWAHQGSYARVYRRLMRILPDTPRTSGNVAKRWLDDDDDHDPLLGHARWAH